MKIKKKLLMKIMLCVIVLFGYIALESRCYASFWDKLGWDSGKLAVGTMILGSTGVGGVIVYAIQVVIGIIALILKGIIMLITGGGGLYGVLFNESSITTADFFPGLTPIKAPANNTITEIVSQVGRVYSIVRSLSVALLLFVLLYIGIRMAISTVADDRARYKKMLTNWVYSIILVYMLHYIMAATFYVSNTLVNTLAKVAQSTGDTTKWGMMLLTEGMIPYFGIPELVTYCMINGVELSFILMYIKRIITLAFLMVIAPLISITYAIDKVGDGKSQALDTWLKEFMFTVLIQPFHCIIYIVLIQTVLNRALDVDFLACILYIVMIQFVKEAENIVKKIFGIHADSMPNAASMGALAIGVASTFGNMFGGKSGSGSSGGSGGSSTGGNKMPNLKEEMGSNETKPTKEKELTPKQQEKAKKKEDRDRRVKDYGEKIKNNKVVKGIGEAAQSVGEKVGNAAQSVGEKVGNAAQSARDTVSEFVDNVGNTQGGQIIKKTGQVVGDVAGWTIDKAGQGAKKIANTKRYAKNNCWSEISSNQLCKILER